MSLRGHYYDDLIKLFYTNLKLLDKKDLIIKVLKNKIRITLDNWINVANLKYEGKILI